MPEEVWSQQPRLISSVTIQAHILDFGLSHPNFYPIYDPLELMKNLVLQNDSRRISMTQGHNRVSERSFGEGPVMMMYQSP